MSFLTQTIQHQIRKNIQCIGSCIAEPPAQLGAVIACSLVSPTDSRAQMGGMVVGSFVGGIVPCMLSISLGVLTGPLHGAYVWGTRLQYVLTEKERLWLGSVGMPFLWRVSQEDFLYMFERVQQRYQLRSSSSGTSKRVLAIDAMKDRNIVHQYIANPINNGKRLYRTWFDVLQDSWPVNVMTYFLPVCIADLVSKYM